MNRLRSVLVPAAGAVAVLVALSCTDTPSAPREGVDPFTAAGAGSGVVLVGAGDIARCDLQNDEATAALLDNIAGTVITLGDNTLGNSTSPPDFTNCYAPSTTWGRHKARTRPATGHMEGFSPGSSSYWQYFGTAAGDSGKFYYSYDAGTWHVVVLNSAISMAAGSTQEQWLRADLAAHPAQCTLAYWHVPRFSSVPNASGVQVLASVKPLWDALYAAGVEVVLNAHYEVYERFAPQDPDGNADPARGIREFIVGTGGIGVSQFPVAPLPNSEIRNRDASGVIELTLNDGSYSWRFIPVAGKTFTDQGQGTCHDTSAPAPEASVTVTPATSSIEFGEREQLTATVRDASGQQLDRVTTWSSSNTGVARVSPRGIVTGWGTGTATITATAGGVSGTAVVTVTPLNGAILVGAGDIASCNALYDEATADLLDEVPGTVFTAGDNAYENGSASDFANCYEPSWGRHKARTRPAVGNHEYSTPNAAGYFGYFGAAAGDSSKGYYSYDAGAWHVVVLNNYKPMAAGTLQEQWLRADLAASTKHCTLAIWHEPVFASGFSHASSGKAAPLWQALYDAGAELVIVGHDHDYERFAPQRVDGTADPQFGIRQIVAGTGGAGLTDFGMIMPNSEVQNNSAHGVLKLTLRDNSYEWLFIPDAGQTFSDSGGTACHGAPTGNQAPTANFTSSCSNLSCSFTDASSDPDGSVTAWSWTFGDGTTSTTRNPAHTYAAGGTYSVRLTVTDDGGATGSVTKSVTVSAANQSPTANFTSSCSNLSCTFTDGSTDPDGSVVAWSWTFGDGGTSTARNPSHAYAAGGTYSVQLTVTDDNGATGSITKSVTVAAANQSPTANFTSNCTNLSCAFTDGSTDPDGSVVAWSWTFGDGGTSTARNPSHAYAASGTYSVQLTVTDDKGATGSITKSVTVAAANQSPTANFTFSCNNLSCTFTDGSTDPDGSVVAWSWTFGDGGTSTARNPSHAYAADGTYSVQLTVTDDNGATGSITKSVTVAAANQSPTANFTSNCTNLSCAFTDGSTDPDGSVVAWSWTFGDGGTSTARNPSHAYAAGGTYAVQLTVTDDKGATGSITKSVTATAPNAPPTANFTSSCTGLSCTFTDGSSDPDGSVVAWSWTFGDGGTSTARNPSHAYAAGGTYSVQLTVTDDRGATASVTKTVTVTAPNQPPAVNAGPDASMLPGLYTLHASFSDPDANDGPWSYTITWGDGFSTSGSASAQGPITATHAYAVPGPYTVRVRVTDSHGNIGSDDLVVTVRLF